MKTEYRNKHVKSHLFGHLFLVADAPAEMVHNVGRDCYLKLVEGMTNPLGAQVNGVAVTPLWRDQRPTDEPRLFQVAGIQNDYKGTVCYRLHAHGGDKFGRCAGVDEVIFVPALDEGKEDYAVTSKPSWHQKRAGHAHGSVLFLKLTAKEAKARELEPGLTLHSRKESPHIWKDQPHVKG